MRHNSTVTVGNVHNIVREELGYCKGYARWVSTCLTERHKY